jgi:hypothetical protein
VKRETSAAPCVAESCRPALPCDACRAREREWYLRDDVARECGRLRSIEAKIVAALGVPAEDFVAWLRAKLVTPSARKDATR